MSDRSQRRSATRRSFLRAVGAGFASFPFLRMLEESVAHAAGAEPPLRFVTMYHPHGVAAELWSMRPGDTETAFDLAFPESSLAPLDPHKGRLVVIEGIDLLSNANGHDSAGTILTGSRIDTSASRPQNPSLDQFLAVDKGLGKGNAVTSIELAVGTDSTVAGETLSFGAGGLPLPKIIDPVQAFDRLFGGFVVPTDAAGQAALARRQKQGKGLVDFLVGDCRRLRARLGPAEQAKLDQHMTALSELEKQLVPTAMPPPTATCPRPTRPSRAAFPPDRLKRFNGGEAYFDAITDAHIDAIALAFACDVTRFATLYMGDLSYDNNPLGLPRDNHGGIAHTYDGSPAGSNGRPSGPGKPATWSLLATFNRYAYGKVARMLDKLVASGIGDSTLVYASSDMGNPSLHSTRNVPTVLGGGANGKFRMGRRLKAPTDCPASNLWCDRGSPDFTGTANNHLLVSIAQAFGVAVDSYGSQPAAVDKTGPLPGLV